MLDQARKILKKYWGYDDFLSPQDLIIQSILKKQDTFALMPTGGGKSITFQVPILMMDGVCLVVSPLIALMKDQVKNLKNKNIKAELISSEITNQEIEVILDNCRFGGVKLLYVSPERIQSHRFQTAIKTLNIAYVAIDEAHCISEWGHDFRPSYLALKNIQELLPEKPILALTATATPYIENEIIRELGLKQPQVFKQSLYRENLAYRVLDSNDKFEELVYLIKKFPGSSIVFCRRRKETYDLYKFLSQHDIDADFFHAGLSPEDKNRKQKEFIMSSSKVLVSTNAFGMGIDKPDIRNVFHLTAPDGIESYIQEVGRAGRDGKAAQGILLLGPKDKENAYKSFRSNLPKKKDFLLIINKLYNYFQVGEHEQPQGQMSFSEYKFIEKFELPKRKTKTVLQFLDQQQIIDIQRTQHQSLIKILIRNTEILDDASHQGKVLSFLARNYGGIFSEPLPIDEFFIAKRLGFSKTHVKQTLKKLHDLEKIFYRDASIIKLSFLVPRDDNFVKVKLYPHFEKLQRVKWQRIQSMYYFIENDSHCKSQLLLRYFGEKNTARCGICSTCKPINATGTLEKSDIISFLQEGEKTTSDIYQRFSNCDKVELLKRLQDLLDEEIIQFNFPNKYTL